MVKGGNWDNFRIHSLIKGSNLSYLTTRFFFNFETKTTSRIYFHFPWSLLFQLTHFSSLISFSENTCPNSIQTTRNMHRLQDSKSTLENICLSHTYPFHLFKDHYAPNPFSAQTFPFFHSIFIINPNRIHVILKVCQES